MKKLTVITGPTASGKTSLAITMARHLQCDIISADSRQIYRDIPITTAAPTADELAAARHHMVGFLPLDAYYSAARFEDDVMTLLERLFASNDNVILAGGSMMYIDAVCRGIDQLPTISAEVRGRCMEIYQTGGLDEITARLSELDPAYLATADTRNPRRMIHALEICLEAGAPYSSLRTGRDKERPFAIERFAIVPDRDEMFDRINRRVLAMVDNGMIDEARHVYPHRHLNSLNTVGFKELFAYFDGTWDLDTAIARIQKNTRVYAKKQLTWLARTPGAYTTLRPGQLPHNLA